MYVVSIGRDRDSRLDQRAIHSLFVYTKCPPRSYRKGHAGGATARPHVQRPLPAFVSILTSETEWQVPESCE